MLDGLVWLWEQQQQRTKPTFSTTDAAPHQPGAAGDIYYF
jgi:hypothetical protein